jgi:hypothetical protein
MQCSKMTSLFDHLVSKPKECRWHRWAVAAFQVDHQFEFDPGLDGKLAWLLALEDAIDITKAGKARKSPPPFESNFWSLRLRRKIVSLLCIPCCVLIGHGT